MGFEPMNGGLKTRYVKPDFINAAYLIEFKERQKGFEPSLTAWKAAVLTVKHH